MRAFVYSQVFPLVQLFFYTIKNQYLIVSGTFDESFKELIPLMYNDVTYRTLTEQ